MDDEVLIRILIGEGSRMSSQLIAAELRRSESPHFEVFLPPSFTSTAVVDEAVRILPDVALISNSLQDGSCAGYSALRTLQSANVATRPVLLLEECEHDLVIDAFRAGARGVFSRTESSELLSKCICSVHKGQIWASTRELEYILKELVTRRPLRVVDARGSNLLSKREEEVVALVADGMTNHQISQQLRLSENTVKNYLFRVFEKLGVSTRVELVLYALYQNRANGTGAQSQRL